MLSGLKINSVYMDENIENIDEALQKEQKMEQNTEIHMKELKIFKGLPHTIMVRIRMKI